jgi:ABC-type multidrug transport system ATPase subunit
VADTIQVQVQGWQGDVADGTVLGRSSDADIQVDDPVVSRRHAQVKREPDGSWALVDLSSANGLYSDQGQQVENLSLAPGTTRFWLGPPDTGIGGSITVAARWDQAGGATVRADPLDPAEAATMQAARVPSEAGDSPRPAGSRWTPAVSAERRSPERPGERAIDGFAVRAENLRVAVDDGKLVILDDATLSIPSGSMTAIIGPSGCGKSTLANLLSGRSTPTSGTVTVDGQRLTPELRKQIGVVPQFDAVHERLTVRQALKAAARLRLTAGTGKDVIDAAVTRAAGALDLEHRLGTRISKLSGGQKKRVSVGYELVASPAMMVLDEPTSGLDPGLELELIEELRALADRGMTTVVVTHSIQAAERADLVVAMAPGGHIAFVGPPAEVLQFFRTDRWSDVFSRLAEPNAAAWADFFAGTETYRRYVGDPPPVDSVVAPVEHRRSWFQDFRVMTARYLRTIVADPRSLLLMAAQAPVLGVLFALVLSTNVFGPSLRPSTAAREFVLAVVLAMVWIGASNSIREIVKERTTFLRERAVGVAPSSLVASRWAVLAGITVIQAAVLYLAAAVRQRTPVGEGALLGSGTVELILALAAVGLASVGIGLVISGFVQDSNKAMAALPIVLIPVILFSGLLIPTSGKPVLEQLSYVDPVQWGSSAAAVTSDVLAKEGCNPTGLEAQLQQALLGRTISCTNSRWQVDASTQTVNLGLAAVAVVVLVAVSFRVTSRSTRNIRV